MSGPPGRDAELALARFTALRGYHPDAVFCVDLEGRFVEINDQALGLTGGYSAEQLIGQPFAMLLYDDDLPAVLDHFATLLAAESSTVEVRFRRGDGKAGLVEIIGFPVLVDGEVVEVWGIAEDIAERISRQRELDDARRAAVAANEAKSAFLATMSHEIRTPLTSVLAAAELLGESELDAQQRQLVTVMERSGERLLRLVNEVLDFSRIEAGRADITSLPFTLADVLDETALMLRGVVEDKGLAYSCTVAPDLPDRLVGDAERIGQVLTNLVDNAAKFTHSGRVDIEVTGPGVPTGAGLAVRFAVTDTGIGMSREQQQSIFDMFEQGDSSVTREYGGTGLGLAISRRLVDLMDGELVVDSEPGVGSTFAFTLPLHAAPDLALGTGSDLPGRVSRT
jgi:PAS domain S-box-containing protein